MIENIISLTFAGFYGFAAGTGLVTLFQLLPL